MPAKKIDLDAERARLYGLPLAEFTPARNTLAAELKKAGQKEAAAQIKDLAKASLSAWAVNVLFSREPQKMDALLAAGRRARAGQAKAASGKGGQELREALVTVRALQDDLRHRAAAILEESGQSPGAAIVDRIAIDLEALAFSAAAEPAAARRWLDADLEPPGFEVLAGLQLAASGGGATRLEPRPAAKPAAPEKAPPRGPSQKETDAQRRWQEAASTRQEREEERRREEREREVKRLRDRVAQAEADHAKAKTEAEARRQEADRAEKEATEAGRRAKSTAEAAAQADEKAGRAAAALRQARRALEEAG